MNTKREPGRIQATRPGDDEAGVQVRRDRRAPLLESLLAGICSAEDTGGVDEQIHRAGGRDRGSNFVRLGGVGDDVARPDLLGCGAQRAFAPGGQHHVVADTRRAFGRTPFRCRHYLR